MWSESPLSRHAHLGIWDSLSRNSTQLRYLQVQRWGNHTIRSVLLPVHTYLQFQFSWFSSIEDYLSCWPHSVGRWTPPANIHLHLCGTFHGLWSVQWLYKHLWASVIYELCVQVYGAWCSPNFLPKPHPVSERICSSWSLLQSHNSYTLGSKSMPCSRASSAICCLNSSTVVPLATMDSIMNLHTENWLRKILGSFIVNMCSLTWCSSGSSARPSRTISCVHVIDTCTNIVHSYLHETLSVLIWECRFVSSSHTHNC